MKYITNDRPDTMHAEWVISNHCNYKCSYCAPILYGNTTGWPDLETALQFWQHIHDDVNPNKKMLTLSGGEPTLWPKLTEFFERLHPSYQTAIVTNGSRTIRWWKQFIERTNIDQVTISCHLEFCDIDHIVEVMKTIGEHTRVTALVMMEYSLVEKGLELVEKIEAARPYGKVVMKPIQIRHYDNDNSVKYEYSDEIKEKIGKYSYSNTAPKYVAKSHKIAAHLIIDDEYSDIFKAYSLFTENEHTFLGWKCSIGTHRLVVWLDGQVSGAQCNTAKRAPYGNLNNGKLDILPKPVTCTTKFCGCAPDVRIPKFDPKKYIPDSKWPHVPFDDPSIEGTDLDPKLINKKKDV